MVLLDGDLRVIGRSARRENDSTKLKKKGVEEGFQESDHGSTRDIFYMKVNSDGEQ